MLQAAISYQDKINARGHAAFLAFESKHGKAMLTKKWSNMNRLITICAQEIDRAQEMWENETTGDLVAQFLDYADWCIFHDKHDIKEQTVTVGFIDKAKDGTLGQASLLLAKLQLTAHLKSLVGELPLGSSTRAEILKVFDHFRGYASFRKSFDGKPGDASTLADPAAEAGDEEDKFDKIRSALGNKTSQVLLGFLFDVFAGDHDEDLSKWCRYDGKGAVAL